MLGWRMASSRSLRFAPDDYLHDAQVNAAEAAAILGLSGPRFRQISGTRETPDPLLGPPRLEKGVRGGRWPLRRVLEYGMHHGRSMRTPIPPLLPRPDGAPRYRPYGVPEQVVSINDGGDRVEAWVQLFEAAAFDVDELLLVLTPLWPSTTGSIRMALPALFESFKQGSGLPRDAECPPAVVMPVVEEHADLWRVPVLTPSPSEPSYHAPYRDVARCLGWPAVPVWPKGTNSASAVAAWAPGRPVTVTIPAAWQARWTAAQYALRMTDIAEDAELANSYLSVWWTVLNSMRNEQLFAPSSLPDGGEWAATLTLPEPPDTKLEVSFIPAVDDVVSTLDAPGYVADTLLSYFGDWKYSGPHTIELTHLPSPWSDRFEAARSAGPEATVEQLRTARLQRLQREAIANAGGAFPDVRLVDQHVFAWTAQHLTWLGWNGYTSEHVDDLRAAWREDAIEVLLTRDSRSNQPVCWTASADGRLSPMPSEQALLGLIPLTRRALGLDPVRTPAPLEQLLRAATTTRPQTLAWPDFLHLLQD